MKEFLKKYAVFILVLAIIATMFCSCRVYFPKEEAGRYYCYVDNVKSETWIEFKDGRVGWLDSEGNGGYVRSGGYSYVYFLYKNDGTATAQDNLFYIGTLQQGVFSFRKVNEKDGENEYCRDYYSDKSVLEYKDSTPHLLYTVIYSVTPSNINSPKQAYHAIRDSYIAKGYYIYNSYDNEVIRLENDELYISFVVKDCDETKALARKIATQDPEASLVAKDNEGNVVLSAKDFGSLSIVKDDLPNSSTSTVKFTSNPSMTEMLREFFKTNPSEQLKLYVFGEYVRDISVNGHSYSLKEFELTRDDVELIVKDIKLAQLGVTLSVVE